MKLKARYSHDCEKCKLIGIKKDYDIYIHPGKGISVSSAQIVARRSSDGPDYSSSTLSVLVRHRLYPYEPYDLMIEALAEYAAARVLEDQA
jgi:hypothetical protein